MSSQGFRALPYHAGLDSDTRTRNQDTFINEEGVIVVATIAFGMGIDKPNVRFVAHLDLPKALKRITKKPEELGVITSQQPLGWCMALVTLLQLGRCFQTLQRTLIINSWRRSRNSLLGYCETTECRRRVLLHYFGDPYDGRCGNCDTCLEKVDQWDGTIVAQQALSAVYLHRQRFGRARYVIDVLRGESNERMVRFGHEGLSVFGLGKNLSVHEWSSVFRQLVAAGYLTVDMGGFGVSP